MTLNRTTAASEQRTTGVSKWIVIKEIPPPHPEMNPIPVGTTVLAKTRLDSPTVVIRRETVPENYFDTFETRLPKRKLIHYLEVYGPRITNQGV